MKEELLNWLEKTGYPLEMRSEKILSSSEFRVLNSVYYKDSELGKAREIDLQAVYSIYEKGVGIEVCLLIECKSSNKPFIHLKKNEPIKDLDGLHLFSNYYTDHKMSFSAMANSDNEIRLPGIVSQSFKMIQGFTNTDETIHKAGNTLLKSFKHFYSESKEMLEDYSEDNFHCFYIPLMVVDSPMFEVQFDKKNELQIDEVNSALLDFGIARDDDYRNAFKFPVVHIDHLYEFGSNVIDSSKQLYNSLIQKPAFQLKNMNLDEKNS